MNMGKVQKTLTRRKVIQLGATTLMAMGTNEFGKTALATISDEATIRKTKALRAVNIMNFIRGEEPRGPMDLMLPVAKQMALIKKHGFPATWLLQYDALVSGPFVEFLKKEMPSTHEVGFWFEMNHKLCDAAGVTWRGRADWGWDYHVPVAYLIGYTPEERIRLADAAMTQFKQIWGHFPRSIASWNLDAYTIAHLSDKYAVDAFAVCRDQDSTDGFTIWGAPIAGYYPSRTNAWSPALDPSNQIHSPIFRLLGQDPVYYYMLRYPLSDGSIAGAPDTMEPVWPSGQTGSFVRSFFDMTAHAPCLSFAYAQLGQENSFGWPDTEKGYVLQMDELARLRDSNELSVETMGETGRQFKRAFSVTPAQAQVQLTDPFGHTDPAEKSIWYQSRYYRANLHCRGKDVFIRDLTVYSDHLPQPFLHTPTREHGIEQRMPSVLDGLHWSDENVKAGGRFIMRDSRDIEQRVEAESFAAVQEHGSSLVVSIPTTGSSNVHLTFSEMSLSIKADSQAVSLDFQWVPSRSALVSVASDRLAYRFEGFDYSVKVTRGIAKQTADGVRIDGDHNRIELDFRQS